MPSKTQRTYTKEELALFAEYQAARATCQPKGCTGGTQCWVKLGPPGYSYANYGYCIECQCMPRREP